MASTPTPRQKQLFFKLLDLDAPARDELLEELGEEDPELAERLRGLLDAHFRAESALGVLDRGSACEVDALRAGELIGPYRLERELGEGAFGRVWLAEQQEPVRRAVALKLLKAGMDTREVVGRFQAERQALARMSHPGIAGVYDAGETDRGRPWFAMEFVDGSPITTYCDEHQLDLHARLELFAAVCRAVQHAHTKGVVHRDLKPNNVLVTEVDGVPRPKVIDFGIAKAVEEPLAPDTPRTRGGQWMGTPAYMAPEQLDAAADVDTRADVYSLGALLFVLLVGEPPFDSASGGAATWHERIRNERPSRASHRVERHAQSSRPGVTRAALRRELDWVVARCLEKDPDRRYDSAAVLANEVERVLVGEPVLAGPPGVTYRVSAFVRRNRFSLVVAASVFLVLFVALLFALDREELARQAETEALESARIAQDAERQAREELARSQAVARLTEHMLLSVKPSVARGADTSLMVEMLERAEQYVLDAEDHSPATEADLARMVGGAWWELGEYQRALPHLERSLELRREALGDASTETLEAAQTLGTNYLKLGDLVHAEPLLRECVEACPPDALTTSESARAVYESYGELLHKQSRLEEALEIRRALVDATVAAHGPRHRDTLRSRNNLAISLEALKQFDEAGEEYRKVLELQLADPELGPDHPHTLMTRSNLSGLMRGLG
ncbi:MAG: protein kinase, partial [Planctomycetes bacterium]|nr:protein kinase [Planctomycetota bacterium]